MKNEVKNFFFAQLIWSMGPIPSSQYPYAEMMWELQAKNKVLLFSSTTGGYSQFSDAFKPGLIGIGLASGVGLFGILSLCGAPTLLLYGCIQGLNQTMPHTVIPQLIGALLSKFYFERRMGFKKWRQYAPVLLAGFSCGMGLTGMFAMGITLILKSLGRLAY